MNAKDIMIGHIYYVDYEPIQTGEFGGKHLAVVLKKNADKITFVTIPLTSKDKGLGINKIELGKLECLPKNLQNNNSYAVIDQIRTTSSKRFSSLYDNGNICDSILPKKQLHLIYRSVIKDFLHDVQGDLYEILLGVD